MQDDLAFHAIDIEFGQHRLRGAVVIPLFGWHFLVMPAVFASSRIHGDNRAEKQVVAAFRAAKFHVMRRTVAGRKIHEVQIGVVRDAVPVVAAAAHLPPLAGPGFGSHGHDGIGDFSIGHTGLAGHDKKAPDFFSGVGIVGSHIAPRTDIAAAVANHHKIVGHAGSASNRQRLSGDFGIGFPDQLTGFGVDGNQTAVECRNDDLAIPRSDAAADRAAAGNAGIFG